MATARQCLDFCKLPARSCNFLNLDETEVLLVGKADDLEGQGLLVLDGVVEPAFAEKVRSLEMLMDRPCCLKSRLVHFTWSLTSS